MKPTANQAQDLTQTQQGLVKLLHWLSSQNYAFTTVSPISHERYLARCTHQTAQNLRDIFGWNLAFDKDLLPDDIFQLLGNLQLIRKTDHGWLSNLRVASLNHQLFIHSAYPTHDAESVFFGPDTYRFVYALNHWLNTKKPKIQHAIELCCGAGPAAVNIAAHFPDAEVLATDINPLALHYAAANAQANQVLNVVTQQSNLFDQIEGEFDLITANPPYLVDSQNRLYRHGGNLLGAELSFNIVKQSLNKLRPNGTLFLYTGVVICQGMDHFYQAVGSFLAAHPHYSWTYEEIDPDLFSEELNQISYPDSDRIAAVVLKVKRIGPVFT